MKKRSSTASAVSGLRRAEHFANGGTIAAWRGRARRLPDERAVANRQACRKAVRHEEQR